MNANMQQELESAFKSNMPLDKIPYMLVIGEKEQTAGTVAVRGRSEGDLGTVPVADFVARLEREVRERSLPAQKGN